MEVMMRVLENFKFAFIVVLMFLILDQIFKVFHDSISTVSNQ